MLARKVKTWLTFELSQSESIEFNYGQSESTTQGSAAGGRQARIFSLYHRLSIYQMRNLTGLRVLKFP
jgi:hypothetical protein